MRLWNRKQRHAFNHHPFTGQGVSLYVNGLYRNLHVIPPRGVFINQGTDFPIGDTNVTKTARIDSTTGTAGQSVSMTPDLSAYNNSTIRIDVRHYKDNVESETIHSRKVTIDSGGDLDLVIRGAYALINTEIRAGGVCRVQFHWVASANGIQPETFKISRTAGPTSPSDVSVTATGTGVYEIDTAALSDSSAYTFDLIAVNTTSGVNRTLDAITFTADATGPAAPTSVTAEVS